MNEAWSMFLDILFWTFIASVTAMVVSMIVDAIIQEIKSLFRRKRK